MLNGAGIIHKSTFDTKFKDFLNTAEEGDWIIASVLRYNTEHRRYELKLIEIS
jgi:hypothetical protein